MAKEMDAEFDRPAGPLVICTIEPEYPQLIGACMQFLSLQTLRPALSWRLRILDGERHPVLMAMAREAGLETVSIRRTAANRFANKWADLAEGLDRHGEAMVLDWDVLNTGGSQFPPVQPGRISARPNPPEMHAAFAARARACSPGCWAGTALPSSINSGVVAGPRQPLVRLAQRIIELEAHLRAILPEAMDWQLEKLAASLAAGETGLEPLAPGWNVTAFSEVPDEKVLFWHYNNGHAATRELKLALHWPEDTEAQLQKLNGRWPRQIERFRGLYDGALRRLQLDRLVRPRGRATGRVQREDKAVPLPTVRNLLAACSSGLCNRLLLLAGAMRAARLTNRQLLLYWPRNGEVGCDFGDLFENDFRAFGERDLHYLLNSSVPVQIYNAWRIRGPQYPDLAPDGDPQAEIVLIKGWYYPKFSHEEYNAQFFEAVREQLRVLRPRRALLERADRFVLPGLCIGVHVRRGDACPEFQLSRDEHFQTIMSALLGEFPNLRFFLCTDDPATAARFSEQFGERIVQMPKSGGGRGTREGMEESLIDLLLLSRTCGIVGNNFSTFSHTAGALGGIPVVFAKEETAVLDLSATVETFRAVLAR